MSVQTTGYITIQIGTPGDEKKFTLNGTVGNKIQVGWRQGPDSPGVVLGSVGSIIESIAKAFGAGPNFKTDFDAKMEGLKSIPPLQAVVEKLLSLSITITDLALTAEYDGTAYKVLDAAFGFKVEFDQLKVGPVELVGFGVLFEYSPNAPEATRSRLSTSSTHALPAR